MPAQVVDDLEEPVQVDVLVGDVGRAVDGLAAILHVLVQLGDQVVLKGDHINIVKKRVLRLNVGPRISKM